MLSHKDRVLKAVGHEEPDRVPIDSWFTSPMLRRICELFGARDEDELRVKLDLDVITLQIHVTEGTFGKTVHEDGSFTDEFGIVWRKPDYRDFMPLKHPIKSEDDLDDYEFPVPRAQWRFNVFYKYVDRFGGEHPVFGGIGFTLFERAWLLRGFKNFLLDLLTNAGFAERLLDRIVEYDVELAHGVVKTGVDVFYIGDDYGMQDRLMISPRLWRSLIKPRLKRIIDVARGKGLPVALHSDGNVSAIVPDLIELGVSVLNPVQPLCMDAVELKEKYGDKLCLWGTLDTQYLLPFGSRRDVELEVLNRIKTLGGGGGLILAPVHTALPDVPLENYLTFVEAAKKYGKYPIGS